MDKSELSEASKEHLKSICGKISVSHHLDAQIQKELYGHMEDKAAAYLSGDEPLSEEDVLILVERHFGDLGEVKTLLREAHPREAGMALGRRLAAGLIALFAAGCAARLCMAVADLFMYVSWEGVPDPDSLWLYLSLPRIAILFASAAGLWAVLMHWQRDLDARQAPWFQQWSPMRMTVLLLAAVALSRFIPVVCLSSSFQQGAHHAAGFQPIWALILLTFPASILKYASLLWWSDRPPRTGRTFLAGSLVVIALCAVAMLPMPLFYSTLTLYAPGYQEALSAVHGTLYGFPVDWSFNMRFTPMLPTLQWLVALWLPTLGCGIGAIVLYAVHRSVHARKAQHG